MDVETLKELLRVTEENGVLKNENKYLKEKVESLEAELEKEKARRKPFKGQLNK
jgi:regulator of replication initiation timing